MCRRPDKLLDMSGGRRNFLTLSGSVLKGEDLFKVLESVQMGLKVGILTKATRLGM